MLGRKLVDIATGAEVDVRLPATTVAETRDADLRVALVADSDGFVTAIAEENGSQKWRRRVTSVCERIVANEGEVACVRGARTEFFDVASGEATFDVGFATNVNEVRTTPRGHHVLLGDGTTLTLERRSGKELARGSFKSLPAAPRTFILRDTELCAAACKRPIGCAAECLDERLASSWSAQTPPPGVTTATMDLLAVDEKGYLLSTNCWSYKGPTPCESFVGTWRASTGTLLDEEIHFLKGGEAGGIDPIIQGHTWWRRGQDSVRLKGAELGGGRSCGHVVGDVLFIAADILPLTKTPASTVMLAADVKTGRVRWSTPIRASGRCIDPEVVGDTVIARFVDGRRTTSATLASRTDGRVLYTREEL